MTTDPNPTDLSFGTEFGVTINGKELEGTWVITGLAFGAKNQLTVSFQTKESFEKEIIPDEPLELNDEEFAQLQRDIASCRGDNTSVLPCVSCTHAAWDHDYAGCNHVHPLVDTECRCAVPFGGRSTGPKD